MSVCQFVLWRSPVSDLTFAAVSIGAPPLTRLRVKVTVHVFFYHYFWNSTAFWKVPRLRPSVLLVRATCRWKWVCSFGGVEWNDTDRTERKYLKKILSEWHFIDQKSHTDLPGIEAGPTQRLNCVQRSSPYRAVNTLPISYTNQSVNVV